jgi:hypothetical protein
MTGLWRPLSTADWPSPAFGSLFDVRHGSRKPEVNTDAAEESNLARQHTGVMRWQ